LRDVMRWASNTPIYVPVFFWCVSAEALSECLNLLSSQYSDRRR
jgi:hypothetical protein